MTFHYKRQFINYLVVGIVIFLIGRVSSPVITIDPEFLILKKMESKLTALKNEVYQLGISKDEANAIDVNFKSVGDDIEAALVHARKRFYSKTITDLISVFVILIGALISVIRSWKRDVSLLKSSDSSG